MARPALVMLVCSLVLLGCGSDDENSSSSNIFTFNNTNRPDTGGEPMDAGTDADATMSDAANTDMGTADAEVDMADPEDMGPPPDMPMIVDEPTIMSVVPQSVVVATTERTFQVTVNLAEPLNQRSVRVTAVNLPDGVSSNGATIQPGSTSGALTFNMTNPAPFRGFVNLEAVALDPVGNPVGQPSANRFNLALTAPAKIDFTQTVPNQILPDNAVELEVTFDQPILNPSAMTMPVYSDIRGLLTGSYDGANSETISFRPATGFLAGENLQVLLLGLETDQRDNLEAPRALLMRVAAAPSGQFSSPVSFNAPVVEQGPMLRLDFDGDDDVDIAVFDASEAGAATSQLCFNNGNATFTCNEFLSGVGVTGAVTGDFDGDGRIDFVVASKDGGPLEQLCLNTDGTLLGLQCNDAGVYTNGYATDIMATDVNLDGRLDLVGTPVTLNPGLSTGERVETCTNNGGSPPQFTCTTSSGTTRFIAPADHILYDFDGDGAVDFLRSSLDPMRTEVCSVTTSPVFNCDVVSTSTAVVHGGISYVDPAMLLPPFVFFRAELAMTKFDVTVNMNGSVLVMESAVPGLSGNFAQSIVADYTGDRRDDGIAVEVDGSTAACSNGGGMPPSFNCTPVLSASPGATSANAVVADFDGDGILDIVVNTDTGGSYLGQQ
jgi:hypothetical protein